MTTEAQKRAHKAHAQRRRDAGEALVHVWLTKPARDRLSALAKVHGSKDRAVEAWLASDDLAPAVAAPAPAPKPPSFSHGRSKTVVVETRRRGVDAATTRLVAVDALSGEAIKPRGALPKGGKRG